MFEQFDVSISFIFLLFFFSFLVFTFAVDVDHASHNRQCSATTCFLQLWIYAVFD